MKFLFLFMDGVGLGADDPAVNPLAAAHMPHLQALLGGRKMTAGDLPVETEQVSLLPLDAVMGVDGLPQSASGQAALLTGKNVPAIIGEHYGPKPNQPVREVLERGTVFSTLTARGCRTALLNAYPARYFEGVNSGKRLYSVIPQAVVNAGVALKTREDLMNGEALSVDFTGEGWHTQLKDNDIPLYSPLQAGRKLGELAASYDFAFFEYWPSDYAGHRQQHDNGVTLLESIDQILGGLLEVWEMEEGLVLLTSDHGNLEDITTRRHTANPVPALLIGSQPLRQQFTQNLHTLADVAPAILQFYPG